MEEKGCTVGNNYNSSIQIDLYDFEACLCHVVSSDSDTVTGVGDVHR
jgi:aerobic-type carbon monoxide dehydrogenase small subunit (CoxS/CutS family)